MENASGIVPLEYGVLVQPSEVEVDPALARARAAGLQLPPDVIEREMISQIVATFIASGGNAFEDWKDGRLPQPGDRILIGKWTGQPLKGADGKEYRLLNDKDVRALITAEGVTRV